MNRLSHYALFAVIIGLGTAGGLWLLWPEPTEQQRNLNLVNAYLPAAQAAIAADPRYSDVTLFAYTGDDGCVGVSGQVRTASDLAALQQAIEATHPPRPIHWTVKVTEEPSGAPPP